MATIKDIAAKAKVAPSTVSRVLSQDSSMSVRADVRKRILEVAQELNYKSPRQRRVEKSKASSVAARTHFRQCHNAQRNLAVVHFLSPNEELNDPFYTSIRIGIENRCHEHDIALRNTFKCNIQTHKGFLANANAVICVGHFSQPEVDSIHALNPNLIFVDSNPLETKFDSVEFDRAAASKEVVSLILASGAKKPAFIGNDETRLYVFRKMTKKAGLYNEKFCKVSQHFDIESGYQAMSSIIASGDLPDVVFASTDIIAIGAYRAIQENGLSIPEQIKIVGMNDIPTAQHLNPSLTSMRLFPVQMGEAAVDLFLELVEGRSYKKKVMLGYEFVWRDSFVNHQSSEISNAKMPLV